MPATELAEYIDNLPPESATRRAELGDLADWSLLASNLADLVDLMHYWLTSEYTRWITDPDDPEVKKARARRKKRKPAPFPIVPPVAARPPSLAARYRENFEDLIRRFTDLDAEALETGVEVRPGVRQVDSELFDRILGI